MMPISVLRSINSPKNSVKKLLITARVISLKETPIINASPPFIPLLMLCLIIEKITGPTDMLNNKPNVIPFHDASNILYLANYKIRSRKCIPVKKWKINGWSLREIKHEEQFSGYFLIHTSSFLARFQLPPGSKIHSSPATFCLLIPVEICAGYQVFLFAP